MVKMYRIEKVPKGVHPCTFCTKEVFEQRTTCILPMKGGKRKPNKSEKKGLNRTYIMAPTETHLHPKQKKTKESKVKTN